MLKCNEIASILFLLLLSLVICSAADAASGSNPHNKIDCALCHKGHVKFGDNIEDIEYSEKDFTSMCTKCHSEIMNIHHPQRVQVTIEVPDYLPVGEGNSINCNTCHDIHAEDTENHLLRSSSIGDYSSRFDMCYDCHIDDFKKISPHKSEKEGISCLVCHRNSPTIKDTKETVTLITENIDKMCNFCHIIDTDKHPQTSDATLNISSKLPLSKNNKVVCITCHDPHGTIDTVNFLREQYVRDIEFGKYENPHSAREYFNCLQCHVAVPRVDKYEECKYDEDYILLCYNCHSTDSEKCHTINIPLEEGMKLPEGFVLNDDDLITCVTCHNPDCSGDVGIRYRNLADLYDDNCSDCHKFDSYSSINPHAGKEDFATCFYCHNKNNKIEDFGMSQKLVCMKCHPYKLHPANVDHLKEPRSSMVLLDTVRLNKKGKIKCSTCHDPHLEDMKNSKLRTFEDMAICEACHQL